MLDDREAVWAVVAEVVDALEADLDALVASVEDRVMARMQTASGEPSAGLHETLHQGVSAAVRDALARLRFDAELPQELLPDLIELARQSARSRCELARRGDPWLVGQEAFWDGFHVVAERTLADAALCWDVIKVARVRLRDYTGRLSSLFRSAYERESERASGVDEDPRLGAVLRVLDSHWLDPDELGYDLACHHIAVVADSSPLLGALARRTERQLLSVRAPDGVTWAWLGGQTSFSDDDLDALIASHRSLDARVAFGEPAQGLTGFAVSHQQALEARAVATDRSAVRYADLRLLIAVLRDGDLAKGFIEHELGDLDLPSERMRELRETLRAYLEHSQSVSATAALRRRARKTIERQLRSAEHLIHHPVSDRSDELLVALRVAEILQSSDYRANDIAVTDHR